MFGNKAQGLKGSSGFFKPAMNALNIALVLFVSLLDSICPTCRDLNLTALSLLQPFMLSINKSIWFSTTSTSALLGPVPVMEK